MAKKINAAFSATLNKNLEKGGAWMATLTILHEAADGYMPVKSESSAWTSASAAKRWLKHRVMDLTPKKNVKMVAGSDVDAKGKPVNFAGEVAFKQEI